MEQKAMTKREFFTAIKNAENLTEELRNYAAAAIEKLDEVNLKRASKPSKLQLENAPLLEKLEKLLGEEPKTANELGEMMGISFQKASGLVRVLEKEGKAFSQEVKVKGKGIRKAYTKKRED